MTEPTDTELLRPFGIAARYRVLVCGSRVWGTPKDAQGRPRNPVHVRVEEAIAVKIVTRLAELKGEELVIITGLAAGADSIADATARRLLPPDRIEGYAAEWDQWGKAAGPMRNQRMLDTGLDLVVALYARGQPFNPGHSRGGTNDMVFRAVLAGVHVHAWVDGGWRTFDGRRWGPQ